MYKNITWKLTKLKPSYSLGLKLWFRSRSHSWLTFSFGPGKVWLFWSRTSLVSIIFSQETIIVKCCSNFPGGAQKILGGTQLPRWLRHYLYESFMQYKLAFCREPISWLIAPPPLRHLYFIKFNILFSSKINIGMISHIRTLNKKIIERQLVLPEFQSFFFFRISFQCLSTFFFIRPWWKHNLKQSLYRI